MEVLRQLTSPGSAVATLAALLSPAAVAAHGPRAPIKGDSVYQLEPVE